MKQIKKQTKHQLPNSLVFSILFSFFTVAFAHPGHHHQAPPPVTAKTPSEQKTADAVKDSVSGSIGIDEKLGNQVPLDAMFATETGDSVKLGDLVKGPTILSFLYYGCSNACGTLLNGTATVLKAFADKPATAPRVVFISVSDRETPLDAMKAHTIGFQSIQMPYPADRWRFLTGPAQSIKKVTDAVGFRFVKKGDDFDHPLCLIILSPDGKVMRYINGADFLPMDLGISLMEAARGSIQPTIARVLRFCFSYDPKSHAFVFNILRVSATIIFSLLGLFIVYLIVSTRKRRKGA